MNNTLFYVIVVVSILLLSLTEYVILEGRKDNKYHFKDLLMAIKLLFAGFLMDALCKTFSVYILLNVSSMSPFRIQASVLSFILCFLLWDLLHYIEHYTEHKVRVLWAIHVNHHSSPFMNFSTALRSGVLKAFYRFLIQIPMVYAGFPVEMYITVYAIGKIWGFITHCQYLGEWKLLGHLFITPYHHAVHHSMNQSDYDKNFGETLVIWDKLFGTFKEKKGELKFGVPESPDPYKFSDVVFHELKSIAKDVKKSNSFKNKILYIFGKPGWKPDLEHNYSNENTFTSYIDRRPG